jgi:FMN-dependent NADH-azoreductase
MNILHLDSSILGEQSVSRKLTASIVAKLNSTDADATVTYHDLAAEEARHLSPQHLAAFHGNPVDDAGLSQDLDLGTAFIDELFAADVIVIGAPMYNFTVPTQLKAWIDRVLVAGRTFHYTAEGPRGLLPAGKKVIVASARGGVYTEGSPAAALEHHETYLAGALGLIGLTNVEVIRAEGVAVSPEAKEAALTHANDAIASLAA